MANAGHDDNRIPLATGVLNTNGTTVTAVKADATKHGVDISDGSTGSDAGADNAKFDDSRIPSWVVESNAGDGAIVTLYVNSSGALMVKST